MGVYVVLQKNSAMLDWRKFFVLQLYKFFVTIFQASQIAVDLQSHLKYLISTGSNEPMTTR